MHKKKVIVVDEKMEIALATLCDIAMKFAGMHMATIVADIANALKEDDNFNFDDFEEEDW
jgi:hypothetical protein